MALRQKGSAQDGSRGSKRRLQSWRAINGGSLSAFQSGSASCRGFLRPMLPLNFGDSDRRAQLDPERNLRYLCYRSYLVFREEAIGSNCKRSVAGPERDVESKDGQVRHTRWRQKMIERGQLKHSTSSITLSLFLSFGPHFPHRQTARAMVTVVSGTGNDVDASKYSQSVFVARTIETHHPLSTLPLYFVLVLVRPQ